MENNIEKVNLRFIHLHSFHRIVTNFQILLASSSHPPAYSARPAAYPAASAVLESFLPKRQRKNVVTGVTPAANSRSNTIHNDI
jgi:hypothetical protein